MRERGAIAIYSVILIVTIVFFSITSEKSVRPEVLSEDIEGPSVTINGRLFEPSVIDRSNDGRIIIIVDQEDLYVGENILEIQWGSSLPSIMTAKLPTELRQH